MFNLVFSALIENFLFVLPIYLFWQFLEDIYIYCRLFFLFIFIVATLRCGLIVLSIVVCYWYQFFLNCSITIFSSSRLVLGSLAWGIWIWKYWRFLDWDVGLLSCWLWCIFGIRFPSIVLLRFLVLLALCWGLLAWRIWIWKYWRLFGFVMGGGVIWHWGICWYALDFYIPWAKTRLKILWQGHLEMNVALKSILLIWYRKLYNCDFLCGKYQWPFYQKSWGL